jgi:hypothetical protein
VLLLGFNWGGGFGLCTDSHLVQVLLKNDCIQTLDMSHNNIEGKSGAMLAEGLERNERCACACA